MSSSELQLKQTGKYYQIKLNKINATLVNYLTAGEYCSSEFKEKMGSQDQDVGYTSITEEGKNKPSSLMEKARKNPFFPIGICAGLTALGWSAYKFKTRGNTKLSLYLIHTRVAAQSAVVGTLTLGVLYNMYQEYVVNPRKQKK